MTVPIPSEWIAKAIKDFVAEAEQADYKIAGEVASTVESIQALPLWSDWTGGVAIRPNGDLIGFSWGEPESAKIEENPHFRFLGYVAGASKYAELEYLLPCRTEDDRDCPFCNGTGLVNVNIDGISCYCGGAGWLPRDVPDPPGYGK